MPDLINLYLAAGTMIPAYQIKEFWIGIENAENLDEALKRVEDNESKDWRLYFYS